uniref:C2H2-type domain-containing protein n=3 Tax=Schistocephalus solidus TaxID=70667 RepID=A0A0X3NRC6_SCHSO
MELLHEETPIPSQTVSEPDRDRQQPKLQQRRGGTPQSSTPTLLQTTTEQDPVDLSTTAAISRSPVISPNNQCCETPLQLLLPSEEDDDDDDAEGGGGGGDDEDAEAIATAPPCSICSSESTFSSGGEASPRTKAMSTRDMCSQDSLFEFVGEEHSVHYESGLQVFHRTSLQADSRRRYRCSLCPATFPWHGDLTEHLRFEHGVQKSRENTRGGKAGNFCCSCCKYVAKYQSELRRHMRLHWGVKPFACVFCPYRSAWKGDLKRHMESHHKECFSSEAELVKIMSQFKNNAGTAVDPDATAAAAATAVSPVAPSAAGGGGGGQRTGSRRTSGPETDDGEEDQQPVNAPESGRYLPEGDNLPATRILREVKMENYPQATSCRGHRGQVASPPPPPSPYQQQSQLLGPYEEVTGQPMSVEPCASSSPLTGAALSDSLFPGFRSWASPLAGFPLSREMASQPEAAGPAQTPSKPCNLLSTNTSQFLSVAAAAAAVTGIPSAFLGCTAPSSYPTAAFNLPMLSVITHETTIGNAPEVPQLTKSEDPQTQPLNLACPKRDPDADQGEPAVPQFPRPLFGTQQTAIKEFMAQFEQRFLINQIMGSLTAGGVASNEGSSCTATPNQVPSPNMPVLAATTSKSLSKFNVSGTLFCWPDQSEVQSGMLKRRSILKDPTTPNASCSTAREEQWKRYQCSGCGHRSNWKWDINKHIKVAHPERTNISTITMELEEARLTLPAYLDKIKGLRNRNCRFASCRSGTGNETDHSDNPEECASTSEGYYRPFKCSLCGHRSNWKWDVKKHIKQMHNGTAEVITLSLEEARRTIHHYKTHRRQSQLRHSFGGSSVETKFPVSQPQCEEFRETDRLEANQWNSPLLMPQPVEGRLSNAGTYENAEGTHPAEAKDRESTAVMEEAPAPTQGSPGFRCSTCKRRLPTWSSLHLHTVFNHGSNKRSYKKALLHKALSSPSAAQLSPVSTPTKLKTSPETSNAALPIFDFTQSLSMERQGKTDQPEPSIEEASQLQRRKAHARRSLVLPVARSSQLSPLRSSALDNCKEELSLRPPQPLQSNIDSDPRSTDKAYELVNLLERVLQLLESAGATSNFSLAELQSTCNQSLLTSLKELAREQATQVVYSVDKESNLSGSECQNTSNEENSAAAYEIISTSGPSERLVELLLQPQVQPLMTKLSALLQKAQHIATASPKTGG